jgi:hypothetical protein
MQDPDLKFDGTVVYSDTHPEIERRVIEGMRRLTAAQKFHMICDMQATIEAMVRPRIRADHPDASEREIQLRIASRRLPADLLRKAVGWDVKTEGY